MQLSLSSIIFEIPVLSIVKIFSNDLDSFPLESTAMALSLYDPSIRSIVFHSNTAEPSLHELFPIKDHSSSNKVIYSRLTVSTERLSSAATVIFAVLLSLFFSAIILFTSGNTLSSVAVTEATLLVFPSISKEFTPLILYE